MDRLYLVNREATPRHHADRRGGRTVAPDDVRSGRHPRVADVPLLRTPRAEIVRLQATAGNRAVQALIPVTDSAPSTAASLLHIQRVRTHIASIGAADTPTISYQEIAEYFRDQVEPQIAEFWSDAENEDDIGDNLARWRTQYDERMDLLWAQIERDTPGDTDTYTFAIALAQVRAQAPGIPSRALGALVTLNNIRHALNTSLTNHPRQPPQEDVPTYQDDTVGVPRMTVEDLDKKKPMVIYRQMGADEAKKILDAYSQRVSDKRSRTKPVLGSMLEDSNKRYWTTTTIEHSKKFVNEGDVDHEAADKIVLRFEIDRQKYMEIRGLSRPAYETGAYDTRQSLIHQEKLVKSARAATRTPEQLDQITRLQEHYNIGFSHQDLQSVDSALKSVAVVDMRAQ